MLPKLTELKFISEYRRSFDEFFKTSVHQKTDFEIFLKKYNCNLQRDYCWNDFQKQELINSILLCRHIPPITVVEYLANYYSSDKRNYDLSEEEFFKPKYQIIDGKQRLLTHEKFINNEFELEIDTEKYFFKDLPIDYQSRILSHNYSCRFLKYDYFGDVSDDDLVELFKWCNFAGTPQDNEYLTRFS